MSEIVINANDRRIQYTASGGQTVFPYDFPIYANTEITVERIRAGVLTTRVLTTDFTVSGVGAEAGGNITLTSGATVNDIYTIYGSTPYERTTDYGTGGDFKASNVNKDFDRLVIMAQQIDTRLNRALTQQNSDSSTAVKLAIETTVARQGKIAEFSSDGTKLQAGMDVSDLEAIATDAEAAQAAAEAAQAAAETAEANAETAETNAETAEANAQAYAAQALAAAAEGLYNDVITITFANSPYVPSAAQDGTLFRCDTSSGNIVVNLSTLATYAEDMKFAFAKTTGDANTVTINRGGSDTIDGSTSKTVSDQYVISVLVGDSATGTWLSATQNSAVADDSITNAKLAEMATNTVKVNATGSTANPTDLALAASRVLARLAAGNIVAATITEILDLITGTPAQGDILFRGASAWSRLAAGTSGQKLQTNGAGADPSWATVSASGIVTVTKQKFTSSGTYTPTSGMVFCIVEAIGGGAGGGGAVGSAVITTSGGGGGAGYYCRSVITAATIGASKTVTIGAGGSGGANTGGNGSAGGATSLGTLVVANSGGVGVGSSTSTPGQWGGAGGAGGLAGDLTIEGGWGTSGIGASITTISPMGGNGGSSILGAGPSGYSLAPAGGQNGQSASANTGAGGAGGCSGSTTGRTGGAGGSGIMWITEFCT